MSEKRIVIVCSAIIIVLCTIAAAATIFVRFPENWSHQEGRFLAFGAILPFVFAVAYFARSRLAKFPRRHIPQRIKPNNLMYAGFILQYVGVGFFQPGINLGLACIMVGLVLLPWGSVKFSKTKGYPAWLGALLGMMSLFGFLILVAIPDRVENT